MKKIMSIVLSMIMAVSVMAMATIPAMAANSPASTTHSRVVNGAVNGSSSSSVTYAPDTNDPNKVTFTYTGTGEFSNWEFPGMTVGVDYDVISEDGNSITVIIYTTADFVANAIVDEKEDTTKKPSKHDKGNKSPNTGAMAATGVAVAGAGMAILAALKKSEDAE